MELEIPSLPFDGRESLAAAAAAAAAASEADGDEE